MKNYIAHRFVMNLGVFASLAFLNTVPAQAADSKYWFCSALDLKGHRSFITDVVELKGPEVVSEPMRAHFAEWIQQIIGIKVDGVSCGGESDEADAKDTVQRLISQERYIRVGWSPHF